MSNIALLIAGGTGNRMGQPIPKQFLSVNDKPVIAYTLEAFQSHQEIDAIAVVCIAGWEHVLQAYANQFNITKLKYIVPGGSTGQESIRNGVFELEKHYGREDIVLVHDAIRPMVSHEIISNVIAAAKEYGNGITTIPCAEAMVITHDGKTATESFPRDNLKREQTPQGFQIGVLADIQHKSVELGINTATTSSSLLIQLGGTVHFVLGSEKNVKLTTVEDIDIFKALLAAKRSEW